MQRLSLGQNPRDAVQVSPARPTLVVAIAAAILLVVAVVFRLPAMLAWVGALLVGLALNRGATALHVARTRVAGLEMLWTKDTRYLTVGRGHTVRLHAELHNRSSTDLHFIAMRGIAATDLTVTVTPEHGLAPALAYVDVEVTVSTHRVGRHGLQGLALEVGGPMGGFEVPLTFLNPFLFDVLPTSLFAVERWARGGRTRRPAPTVVTGPTPGDSIELRELREHRPGDALRKVAWKASARRGVLLVRDDEREEHDRTWFVLDASVELWSGVPGRAALDIAIDQTASLLRAAHRHGDLVGLAIVAARLLTWLPPESGREQIRHIAMALAHQTGTRDADRSGLDEDDAAIRVLDHLKPSNPQLASSVRPHQLDRIAEIVAGVAAQVPRLPIDVAAPTARERTLRRYLAAYGLPSPARVQTDREQTDRTLVEILSRILPMRPSRVVISSPWPSAALLENLRTMMKGGSLRRNLVWWLPADVTRGLALVHGAVADTVDLSAAWRRDAAAIRGRDALMHLGIRVQPLRRPESGLRPSEPGS